MVYFWTNILKSRDSFLFGIGGFPYYQPNQFSCFKIIGKQTNRQSIFLEHVLSLLDKSTLIFMEKEIKQKSFSLADVVK